MPDSTPPAIVLTVQLDHWRRLAQDREWTIAKLRTELKDWRRQADERGLEIEQLRASVAELERAAALVTQAAPEPASIPRPLLAPPAGAAV